MIHDHALVRIQFSSRTHQNIILRTNVLLPWTSILDWESAVVQELRSRQIIWTTAFLTFLISIRNRQCQSGNAFPPKDWYNTIKDADWALRPWMKSFTWWFDTGDAIIDEDRSFAVGGFPVHQQPRRTTKFRSAEIAKKTYGHVCHSRIKTRVHSFSSTGLSPPLVKLSSLFD